MKSFLSHGARVGIALCVAAVSLAGCSGDSKGAAGSVPSNCTPAHPDVQTLTKGELKVNVLVSAPYALLDGSKLTGIDGEIVNKIAALECLSVQPASTDGPALIKSIQSKRADVAIGGIYYTKERAAQVTLSDTMYRDGMAILSKQGFSTVADLKGHKVGTVQSALWQADLQKVLGADNVVGYPSPAAIMADLKAGRLDAAVMASSEAAVRVSDDKDLKAATMQADPEVAATTSPGKVVMAIVPDNKSLTDAINADLATLLKDGSIAKALTDNKLDAALAGGGTK